MKHFPRASAPFLKFPEKVIILFLLLSSVHSAVPEKQFNKTEVIYGRKHGMALTMVIYEPDIQKNGIGFVWLASGGYRSDYNTLLSHEKKGILDPFLRKGFTIFAVLHPSEPRFSAVEMPDEIHRSILLNYGAPGVVALGVGPLSFVPAPFDFKEWDSETKTYERITDQGKIHEIGRRISPLYHVTADDPPVLLFHGTDDPIVPIQQAEILMEKLKSVGVPARLIAREGKRHGWKGIIQTELDILADWFLEQFQAESDAAATR